MGDVTGVKTPEIDNLNFSFIGGSGATSPVSSGGLAEVRDSTDIDPNDPINGPDAPEEPSTDNPKKAPAPKKRWYTPLANFFKAIGNGLKAFFIGIGKFFTGELFKKKPSQTSKPIEPPRSENSNPNDYDYDGTNTDSSTSSSTRTSPLLGPRFEGTYTLRPSGTPRQVRGSMGSLAQSGDSNGDGMSMVDSNLGISRMSGSAISIDADYASPPLSSTGEYVDADNEDNTAAGAQQLSSSFTVAGDSQAEAFLKSYYGPTNNREDIERGKSITPDSAGKKLDEAHAMFAGDNQNVDLDQDASFIQAAAASSSASTTTTTTTTVAGAPFQAPTQQQPSSPKATADAKQQQQPEEEQETKDADRATTTAQSTTSSSSSNNDSKAEDGDNDQDSDSADTGGDGDNDQNPDQDPKNVPLDLDDALSLSDLNASLDRMFTEHQ